MTITLVDSKSRRAPGGCDCVGRGHIDSFVVRGENGGVGKCYKSPLFFTNLCRSLLLSFHITFFLASALPWHSLWNELRMTIHYDDSKGKSPFPHHAHLSLTLLSLTSSNIPRLFLSRFNRISTDIGSLAAGMDGHVARLGIGRKGHCRFCSHCTSKGSYYLAHFLWPLPLTRLAPLTSSPLLHSVAHYTRLVTLWQVFYISLQETTWAYSLTIVSSSQ
jgi:hypothetical protein